MDRRRIRIPWGFWAPPRRTGLCAGSFSSFSNLDLCLPTFGGPRVCLGTLVVFYFSTPATTLARMQYRRLGDAGMKISEIGLGGWLTVGNAIDSDTAAAVMNKSFDLGINFYDTADVYAQGKSEEVWGQLLKDRRRADYVLASKVFFPYRAGAQ